MTVIRTSIVDAPSLDLSTLKLTDEQFYQLCIANPEQPLELTEEGVLVFMSPVGGESGKSEGLVAKHNQLVQTHPLDRKNAFGIWKGDVWMSDDFNAPLDDLQEYM
jgi:Protein of unknown function (DUF2281)